MGFPISFVSEVHFKSKSSKVVKFLSLPWQFLPRSKWECAIVYICFRFSVLLLLVQVFSTCCKILTLVYVDDAWILGLFGTKMRGCGIQWWKLRAIFTPKHYCKQREWAISTLWLQLLPNAVAIVHVLGVAQSEKWLSDVFTYDTCPEEDWKSMKVGPEFRDDILSLFYATRSLDSLSN
jgi:hypothetical protein